MKVLWASNSPTVGTGYGQQTSLFAPRIKADGHDVALYQSWGGDGLGVWKWEGMHVYPTDHDWGNRTMYACAAHHGQGALTGVQIIALCDAWVLRPNHFPNGLRLAIWAPVDHRPLPPGVRNVLKHEAVTPIAMSMFGKKMMQNAGLNPLYVPHGIDTTLFRPQPENKASIRGELGLPESAFVIGMVAANKSNPACHRKAFPQVMQAFAKFRERHADAILYLHTSERPYSEGGIKLRLCAEACGLPERSVRFSDQMALEFGPPSSAVANLYPAFDATANPSLGEGFGIPIVESQACGIPVVTTDHTAMTELTGAGWAVDGDEWYDPLQDSFYKVPSIAGLVAAFEEAYLVRDGLADKAREFAVAYDADRVFNRFWRPALERLNAPAEVAPLGLNRSQRRQLAKATA
jgi:glycosyltransferase involved in cell wall biosynthesis